MALLSSPSRGTMAPMTQPPLRVDRQGERLRLLHVHAHPDDESSKGAATTAKYVAEGVEVVVATCTGGERGSILNPAMDRPDVLADIGAIRRAEMDRAREILGVEQVWLGFVDSGLPEGDPLPPLPDGCFARARPGRGGRAAGQGDPAVPAARADHVRRERRLPAPGPHHVPQDQRRGLRRRRRPGRLPGAGRAVADAQAVLLLHLPPRPDGRPGPGDDRARPGVAVRRPPEGLAGGPGAGGPDHHPGAVRGLLRRPGPGAAGPRHPGRSRTASGSRCRSTCTRAVWPTEDWQRVRSLVDAPLPEDDLFAGIAVPADRDRLASAEVGRVSA